MILDEVREGGGTEPGRARKFRLLRNGFVRPGGVDQSGHQGDPGDSRARDHEQRAPLGNPQRLQHVDVAHSWSAAGGSWDLHVPGQHGSHEEPGTRFYVFNRKIPAQARLRVSRNQTRREAQNESSRDRDSRKYIGNR